MADDATISYQAITDAAHWPALAALLSQLCQKPVAVDEARWSTLLDQEASFWVGAFADDTLVGCAMLCWYDCPTARKAWIEDVVVDDSYRGQGIGEAMTRACMNAARDQSCDTVLLTSRSERAAANRLYQRLGFQLRDTNCYSWKPS